jgi:hypothetical protein
MTNQEKFSIEKKSTPTKSKDRSIETKPKKPDLPSLLRKLGNRSIQRLVVQRKGNAPFQLDDETAGRINRERGGGAPLESKLQMQMSDQMGFDMSGVRVHTSSTADQLNQQLNAKAFTTGQDVFFKSGAYQPDNSGGQELLAHELTHVVQQGTGQVSGENGMTVHAPGDQYEQEADSVAHEISSASAPTVQMQEIPEEEVAMQEDDELQMQEDDELEMQEEDELQMNGEEEEEALQTSPLDGAVQRIEEYERIMVGGESRFNKEEGEIPS